MLLVVLFPLLLGALAFALPSRRARPLLLLAGAVGHAAGVAWLFADPGEAIPGWLELDAPGKVVLATVSALFLASAAYAQRYLRLREDRENRVFVGGLLVLLAALSVVALSQHLGLLWVAIEVTTLTTAPLIYFDRDARSLEAAWKYLLVCSLGVALALLGTFFLALASAAPGGPRSLVLRELVAAGPALSRPWVRAAFVFLLVGYGTKMGLAPLHSWKPDAYGEAPGLLGALLSGGVTSAAFLALARVLQVCGAAGEGDFSRQALLVMGLLSMALACVFIVGQRDYKRMLAYSSVEHMGILAVGLGVGGAAGAGAFFHALNNGLVKGVLFLAAGSIHRSYGTKRVDEVRGALRRLPLSGPLFLAGFFAVTGAPPFGPFFSELAILQGAFGSGHAVAGALFLAFTAVIFVGMGSIVLGVVQGDPEGCPERPGQADGWGNAAPPLALLAASLVLGLWLPPSLRDLFAAASATVGGRP
ncbi:proton-conducting transporter transmembrane domain-containing protein [Anaeromyxobacter paludicola]|uniref:Hydrogenase n=1 Tax=Anaeromyxobacter paludicola TaxID=2918171 RepID=A0ABN6ND59_9BACT|nr:proton-conducting transporter membrane subunit [Anaeromyxobacter paludicola]BDG10411.1 hydrogenase [Anaeromyxobacter paludicola]